MRIVALIALLFLTLPAFAAGWGQYTNQRFGYQIDIPPGFEGVGESANGDGQVFGLDARAQILTVWGGAPSKDFESEVAGRMAKAIGAGWHITFQVMTPEWASFSAVVGQRAFVQRMISLCGGRQYAAFRLTYSEIDTGRISGDVEQLVGSLNAVAGAC